MDGDEGDVVTAADVAALNSAAIDRSATLARLTGAGLVVVGTVAALGWLWMSVRTQQQLEDGMFVGFGETEQVDAEVRLDQFAINLWMIGAAAAVVGLGAAMRVLADYAQARAGGSITGFQVGDRFTDEGLDEDLELEPDL